MLSLSFEGFVTYKPGEHDPVVLQLKFHVE
jgi:hypothetical protein